MKLFIVHKILSLDEKQILFKNAFKRILTENYILSQEAASKYHRLLNDEYFINYNLRLEELKDPLSISNYAAEIIQNQMILANQASLGINYLYVKYALIGIVVVVLAFGGFMLIKSWLVETKLEEGAKIQLKGAELSADGNKITTSIAENQVNLAEAISDVLEASIIPATQVNEQVVKAFNNVSDALEPLKADQELLITSVTNISKRVDHLYKHFNLAFTI